MIKDEYLSYLSVTYNIAFATIIINGEKTCTMHHGRHASSFLDNIFSLLHHLRDVDVMREIGFRTFSAKFGVVDCGKLEWLGKLGGCNLPGFRRFVSNGNQVFYAEVFEDDRLVIKTLEGELISAGKSFWEAWDENLTNRRLDCIKAHREMFGTGLKEALDAYNARLELIRLERLGL